MALSRDSATVVTFKFRTERTERCAYSRLAVCGSFFLFFFAFFLDLIHVLGYHPCIATQND